MAPSELASLLSRGSRRALLLCWVSVAFCACTGPVIRDIPMLRPKDPHFEIERTYPVRSAEFQRAISSPDLARAERYAYDEWQSRPWRQKAVNWLLLPCRREF